MRKKDNGCNMQKLLVPSGTGTRRRFCCFIIVAALGLSNSLDAADKWLSIRSKNFLLVGNGSESQIRRVGRNLEEFRAGFAVLFPSTGQQSSPPITVIVFKDDASFRPFKPLYEGKPANVAGYFQAGSDANYIALTGDTETPRVIYHEFVHSLTKDAASSLPLWASEGLAELYSMFELSSDTKQMLLGRAIAEHVVLLNQRTFLPIRTLVSVEHDSAFYNEQTKQGIFYAESWAAVHYLILANSGQRQPQFTKYLSLLSSGRSIDDSFREAFQMSYDELERELRQYVQARVSWPAIQYTLQTRLAFDREMQVSPLTEAQAQYYLGDLMLHMDRLDTAETLLQKAISFDPKFAPSYASMGMVRMRQNRHEDALKFLTTAVEGDSKNHMAHYYYAHMLEEGSQSREVEERRSQLELARTHIKKTIDLAPDFIEAYSLLGYLSLVLRDELAETETVLKKAISLAPGRQQLRLTLAEVMAFNNETPAARVIATQLKNSADGDVRQRAEMLLASLDAHLENERALLEYEERRKAVATAEASEVRETSPDIETSDERPRLSRAQSPPASDDSIVGTARPQPTRPAAIQIEGFLTAIDCSLGMTMRLRVGNGIVELHSDTPEKIEFMSYVAGVSGSIACGSQKPEPPVRITYKRGPDAQFLGEPLRVDFVEKK